jgi:excisionase family DNA binding protein
VTGSEGRPALAAPVAGFGAFVVAKALKRSLPDLLVSLQRMSESGRAHPDLIGEVTATWAAINAAAEEWSQWRTAADGRAAERVTAIPERSTEIDTDTAAGLLHVSPNRIRQLIRGGDLPGRKVGRTWLVDRTAIDLRRELEDGHVR